MGYGPALGNGLFVKIAPARAAVVMIRCGNFMYSSVVLQVFVVVVVVLCFNRCLTVTFALVVTLVLSFQVVDVVFVDRQ